MRLAILSRDRKSYSSSRLLEAARERGHEVRVLDTGRFSIGVEKKSPKLLYQGKPVARYDAIIPRIGASVSIFGSAAVRQFEQMGVFSLNSSHAISVANNKLRSLQVLSRHDIDLPASAFVSRREDVLPAIERVGGAPVMIKLLEGSQGIGVILAESNTAAEAIVEAMHNASQNVLIQKFVAESKGKDIRALVVGGRVVASIRRQARGQEFRSNIHRGGVAQKISLDPEYERTAVLSAHILGLHVAGVDMLEAADGPKVMEVNASPGLEGIEGATGIDIAANIIEFLEEAVLFPEVDLRQKLTLGKGYEIVELLVSANSGLKGRTIKEAGFNELEILPLRIDRNGVLLTTPGENELICSGDKILCYGKRLTLKSMIAAKAKSPVSKTGRS